MSNRDALAQAKPKTVEEPIGDGRSVTIRALSGSGRTAYIRLAEEAKERGGLQPAEVVALALVEPDGTPSFDAKSADDLAFLGALDGEVLDRIALRFYELSGLSSKSVEEAAKN